MKYGGKGMEEQVFDEFMEELEDLQDAITNLVCELNRLYDMIECPWLEK